MMQGLIKPTHEVGSTNLWEMTEPGEISWPESTCLEERHGSRLGSNIGLLLTHDLLKGVGGRYLDPETDQSNLRKRLNNADRHFRRKAAAVFNDPTAVSLLKSLRSRVLIETEEFDFCGKGRALAKLTAANFCEIGANSVYITEPGQRFVDKISEG